jgi:peptidoglycan/LPS O-acetylase OafA/YrhL
VAYLVAVIALAAFTYRRIEEPARTAFNRLARGLEARRARPTGLARR